MDTTEPMDFEAYERAVLSKASTVPNTDTEKLSIAVLGMVGETGEMFDLLSPDGNDHLKTNEWIKEMGDVLWYIAYCAKNLGSDLRTVSARSEAYRSTLAVYYSPHIATPLGRLSAAVAVPAERLKKHLDRRTPIDTEVWLNDLGKILCHLVYIAAIFDCSLQALADANVKKLRARFPEGVWNAARADGKAEEKIQPAG